MVSDIPTGSGSEVAPEEIRYIQFQSTSYQISMREIVDLSTQVTPNVSGFGLVWEIDDPLIATIDSSGVVEGLSPGITLAHLTLAQNDMLSCAVQIIVSPTSNQRLNYSDLVIYKMETAQLDVQGEHPGLEVSWSSSSPNVAAINNTSGIVTGLTLGESRITAFYRYRGTDGVDTFGIIGTCRVKVESKVRGITIQPKNISVQVGDQFSPVASVQKVDNSVDTSVLWISSNPSVVALIPGSSGSFRALATGTCVLTARPNASLEKSATMGVTVTTRDPSGLSLFPRRAVVTVGQTVKLFASSDSDGTVVWTSSATANASVSGVENSSGIVVAKRAGTVTVTARLGTRIATADVIIENPAVTEVLINPRAVELSLGMEQDIVASVFPADVSQNVQWELVRPNNGEVELDTRFAPVTITGRRPGRIQVRAYSTINPEYFGTCDVIVKSPPVTQVSLTPKSLSLFQGQTATLNALIAPTSADQTVTWRSLNVVIAEVENGRVTAKSAGSTEIEAKSTFDSTKWARIPIEVKPISIESVTVPGSAGLNIGQTVAITAEVSPGIVPAVKWKSFDETIARVNQTGQILGVGPGTVRVRASSVADDTKVGDCLVRVTEERGVGFTILNRSYWYPNLGDSVSRALFMTPAERQAILSQNSNSDTSWLSDVNLSENSLYYYLVVYIDEPANNLFGYVTYLDPTGGVLTVHQKISPDPKIPSSIPVLPNHSYVRLVLRIPKLNLGIINPMSAVSITTD